MALGGCVWLGGIVGSMIALFLRKRSATKKRLAELRAAPNDPDKPPVADMPEFGGEWNMGLSAFYPSSGQEGFYEIDLAFQGAREASDRRL